MTLKKMSYTVLLAFFGALLSAGAAMRASMEQAEESKRNSELNAENAKKSDTIARIAQESRAAQERFSSQLTAKQEELFAKQEELIELGHRQTEKSDEIARLNADIAKKSEEIARLSTETVKYVTGGDSYCYVSMSLGKPTTDSFPTTYRSLTVSLHHEGKYPVSDLSIAVSRQYYGYKYGTVPSNQQRGYDMPPMGTDQLWNHNIGTIPAAKSVVLPLQDVFFEPGILQSYHFTFRARNGYWRQDYNFRYDKEGKLNVTTSIARVGQGDGYTEEFITQEKPEPYWSKLKIN